MVEEDIAVVEVVGEEEEDEETRVSILSFCVFFIFCLLLGLALQADECQEKFDLRKDIL